MLLSYGKKFTDQWGMVKGDELVDFWTAGLAGYSPTELKRGRDALDERPFPPTLPEFKKLCRKPIDPTAAYYEAVEGVQARAAGEYGRWSHPAIYWAAMPLSFDLGSQTQSQIKSRWDAALDEQIRRGEWPEIPQPMLALAAPGQSKTNREDAEKHLRKLGAASVVKDVKGDGDRRWARRVLEREAAGDTHLPMISVKWAREVLNPKPVTAD